LEGEIEMNNIDKTDNTPSYFFCIGCQKSGTTILARLLDQHPDIACLWEAYFLNPRNESSVFNPESKAWSKHGYSKDDVTQWSSKLKSSNPFSIKSRITHKITGQFSFPMQPYKEVITEALNDFASRCNVKVVGDKWPWYIEFLDQMIAAFPGAKYIYTVRDPRGIWNSAQRFKDRNRGDEILNEMLVKDTKISQLLKRDDFYTVRYEDLICKPEETCKELYAFLGCSYSDDYLKYSSENDPYPERWNWVPEASGKLDPEITVKWQKKMTSGEIKKVNSTAGVFIEKYGYEK
jgi:hypothetical protein